MRRICDKCRWSYDDQYRSTICPHPTFAANDGQNNFAHHPESLRYPTGFPDDRFDKSDHDAAVAIVNAAGNDRERARLIADFWRDADRADRSPRDLLVFHVGMLGGMCDRLLDELDALRAVQIKIDLDLPVGWSDKREKSGG